ncbi:hypothetical protein PENTCL1PPCAC_19334, partial [Pristionchus entomophagus]
QTGSKSLQVLQQLVIHIHISRTKWRIEMRSQEPALPVDKTMDRRTAIRMAGVGAVLALLVVHYNVLFESTIIPAPLVSVPFGLLFITLIDLLDSIRTFLVRFNGIILAVIFVICIACIVPLMVQYPEKGEARDEFLKQWMTLIVLGSYVTFLLIVHFDKENEDQKEKRKLAEEDKINTSPLTLPYLAQLPNEAASGIRYPEGVAFQEIRIPRDQSDR